MRYWSKGLGRRSALNIDWAKEKVQIRVEEGRALLASVVPRPLFRVEVMGGEQVVVAGETLPPVVWNYISVLAREDFEDILKLAMSQEVVAFLTHHQGGRRLFLNLSRLLVVFLGRYLWTWAVWKIRGIKRPGFCTS